MNMNGSTLSALVCVALLTTAGLIACDGPFSADEGSEFETDCRQVCDEYKDCYEKDFDADACSSECIDESIRSTDFQKQVDDCEECMDDETCLSGVFACASECGPVIDEST